MTCLVLTLVVLTLGGVIVWNKEKIKEHSNTIKDFFLK